MKFGTWKELFGLGRASPKGQGSASNLWLLHGLPFAFLIPGLVFAALKVYEVNENNRAVFERSIGLRAECAAASVDRQIAALVATLRVLSSGPPISSETKQAFFGQAVAGLEGTGVQIVVRTKSLDIVGMSDKDPAAVSPLTENAKLAVATAFSTMKPQFSLYDAESQKAARGFDLWLAKSHGSSDSIIIQAHVPSSYLSGVFNAPDGESGWMFAVVDGNGGRIAQSGGHSLATNGIADGKQEVGSAEDLGSLVAAPQSLFESSTDVGKRGWRLSISAPLLASQTFAQRNWTAFWLVYCTAHWPDSCRVEHDGKAIGNEC